MSSVRLLTVFMLVVASAVVQTTAFHSVRAFGQSPDLVLLMVVVATLWTAPEAALLMAFSGGLLVDILGSAPLGLSALSSTVACYVAIHSRHRFSYGLPSGVLVVGTTTFVALGVNALVGTLFGEGTLVSRDIIETLVLVPIYNMALALIVLPMSELLFVRADGQKYRVRDGL